MESELKRSRRVAHAIVNTSENKNRAAFSEEREDVNQDELI